MKLIVRADDMGYSVAYNYGYYESIKNGIVTCAELMVDMPAAKQAVEMLKDFPWIPIGIHLHLCGLPCADPEMIPNLIGEDGYLLVKQTRNIGKEYPFHELYIEGKAQIERFIQLVGRKPDVISNISDENDNYSKVFRKLVEEFKINYMKGNAYYKWVDTKEGWSVERFLVQPLNSGRKPGVWGPIEDQYLNYNPEKALLEENEDNYKDEACYYVVFHPGYVDGSILKNSRLTVGRIKDVDACTSKAVKEKLKKEKVKLITCNDLMYGTNDYQIFCKRNNK